MSDRRPAEVEVLARFVDAARFEDLSTEVIRELKIRVLDSLGCAIGALDAEPIPMIRAVVDEFGGSPLVTLIGGGSAPPDRAALFNGALVRYLDFMDSYLAKGETNHPSDNLAPVLAAAEYNDLSGEDFLVALAVAYQVHTRLSDVAPVRHKGFDHTTQGAYAVAAGVAKALGLSIDQTANAIAISGTANNALRVTRTGRLSHWKGLAYPNMASAATLAAFLAKQGVTGPLEVFEGNKGFKETIAGPFEIDWSAEDMESVRRTLIKKYNAEIHAQSAVEAVVELRERNSLAGTEIDGVDIDIFDVAFNIIGGGEEDTKTDIRTKEEADHSLPYMIAVALLDGELLPGQYTKERIRRNDVQQLLRRVAVRSNSDFSREFPDRMPVHVTIRLADGRSLAAEKHDYEGFHSHPMSWERAAAKFHRLAEPHADTDSRKAVAQAIGEIETLKVREFARIVSGLRKEMAA